MCHGCRIKERLRIKVPNKSKPIELPNTALGIYFCSQIKVLLLAEATDRYCILHICTMLTIFHTNSQQNIIYHTAGIKH